MPTKYEDPLVKYANSDEAAKTYSPTSITSQALAPIPSPAYTSPSPAPAYPVGGLGVDPFAMTEPEQKAQGVSDELGKLYGQQVGESSFRAEQETAQGVPALNQTVKDLTSRLNTLKNEALAIPLQIQQEYQGRGATAGGVAPIQTGRLRENAIQALSVNSLLEASRGNLTTALDMVDRAVAQKFDPIREEIAAKQANLQLIMQSPAYSLADKKRAAAQKAIQDAKAAQLERDEQNMRDIQDVALAAAKNGASGVVLQAIQAAIDPLEAIEIAAQYGALKPADKPNLQAVKLDNGNTVILDMNTGQTVRSIGGATGGGGPLAGSSSPLNTQQGYQSLTAKQKNQADSLNSLVRTLKDYKDFYNDNPGILDGLAGNLFGADSGVLQTKVNSIIFAAAQAEGTGALQQADRQVIEKIIPNPTSFGGALSTLFRGGKGGNIAKLDDQIQKYTENLSTNYGLQPTTDPSPNRTGTLRAPTGDLYDASELTEEEYQQALKDGYLEE